MVAKEYLKQVEKIDKLILNKKFERDQWLSIAEGTAVNSDGDRVQSSIEPHKMENAVVKAVEIDENIKSLEEQKKEIIKTIEELDVESYDILHKRYIQYMSLETIGEVNGYAWSTIKNKHKKAISKLQTILDSRLKNE